MDLAPEGQPAAALVPAAAEAGVRARLAPMRARVVVFAAGSASAVVVVRPLAAVVVARPLAAAVVARPLAAVVVARPTSARPARPAREAGWVAAPVAPGRVVRAQRPVRRLAAVREWQPEVQVPVPGVQAAEWAAAVQGWVLPGVAAPVMVVQVLLAGQQEAAVVALLPEVRAPGAQVSALVVPAGARTQRVQEAAVLPAGALEPAVVALLPEVRAPGAQVSALVALVRASWTARPERDPHSATRRRAWAEQG